jgi:hypothetical protein
LLSSLAGCQIDRLPPGVPMTYRPPVPAISHASYAASALTAKRTPICKWPPRPHAVAPDREFGRFSAVLHRESSSARKRTYANLPSSAPTAGAVAYIPGAMVPVQLGSSVAQVSNHLSTTASPRGDLQHPPALFPIVPWRAPLCVRLLRRCTSAGLSWLGV